MASSKRRQLLYLIMVAVALEVATLAMLQSYRSASEAARETEQLASLLNAAEAAEWEAIASLDPAHLNLDEGDRVEHDVEGLVIELNKHDVVDRRLLTLVDDYFRAVEQEMAAVQAGRRQDAIELDETLVDPLFEAIIDQSSAASETAHRRAVAAGTTVAVGLMAAVAIGVVAATRLVRYSERAHQLMENNQAKDRFLATVSHELRTPLTAIRGYAEVLDDPGCELDAKEQREMIRVIAEQTREMSGLIEDLLVGARAEMESLSIQTADVEITSLLRSTIDGLRQPASATLDVIAAAETWVSADRARLGQIIRNLVTNAFVHGGPRVVVSVREAGDRVTIDVSDDGPGVSEADRDQIFRPYVSGSGTRAAGSVGIGLYVSRELARLMGGDVTYEDESGESTFRITLPAARPAVLSTNNP